MITLNETQIKMINSIGMGYIDVGKMGNDEEGQTFDSLVSLKLVRQRKGVPTVFKGSIYELSLKGIAFWEEMKAYEATQPAPAANEIEAEAPTEATLGDELYEESAASVEENTPDNMIYSESGLNLSLMMIPDDSPLATASYAERMAALKSKTAEPTGPARNADERAAMNTFDPEYDYMSMTPKVEYARGDKAIWRGRIPVVIVEQFDYIPDKRVVRMDVQYNMGHEREFNWDVKIAELSHIDPRDAEIEQLKAENATLKSDRLSLLDTWNEFRAAMMEPGRFNTRNLYDITPKAVQSFDKTELFFASIEKKAK